MNGQRSGGEADLILGKDRNGPTKTTPLRLNCICRGSPTWPRHRSIVWLLKFYVLFSSEMSRRCPIGHMRDIFQVPPVRCPGPVSPARRTRITLRDGQDGGHALKNLRQRPTG
jgi:hypothetical protein